MVPSIASTNCKQTDCELQAGFSQHSSRCSSICDYSLTHPHTHTLTFTPSQYTRFVAMSVVALPDCLRTRTHNNVCLSPPTCHHHHQQQLVSTLPIPRSTLPIPRLLLMLICCMMNIFPAPCSLPCTLNAPFSRMHMCFALNHLAIGDHNVLFLMLIGVLAHDARVC